MSRCAKPPKTSENLVSFSFFAYSNRCMVYNFAYSETELIITSILHYLKSIRM